MAAAVGAEEGAPRPPSRTGGGGGLAAARVAALTLGTAAAGAGGLAWLWHRPAARSIFGSPTATAAGGKPLRRILFAEGAPGVEAVCVDQVSSYAGSHQCTSLVKLWQSQRARLESDCTSGDLTACVGDAWKHTCTGGQWFRHSSRYITDTYPCTSVCQGALEKEICCKGCRLIEQTESMKMESSFSNVSATLSTRRIECPGCCVDCQAGQDTPSLSSQCQNIAPHEVVQAEHCMVSPCHTCGNPLDKAKCCAACLETRCSSPGNKTECWGCDGPTTGAAIVSQVTGEVTEDITMSDRPSWYTWLGIVVVVVVYLAVIGLVVFFCVQHTRRENHWRFITVLGNDTISDTSWQPGRHPPRPDETDKWMGIFKGARTTGGAGADPHHP